jgi:20S proteasome alpha/beta subunit
MEAINHAGTAVGVLSNEGIVFAAEKKVTSKLLEENVSSEKMYRIGKKCCSLIFHFSFLIPSLCIKCCCCRLCC